MNVKFSSDFFKGIDKDYIPDLKKDIINFVSKLTWGNVEQKVRLEESLAMPDTFNNESMWFFDIKKVDIDSGIIFITNLCGKIKYFIF